MISGFIHCGFIADSWNLIQDIESNWMKPQIESSKWKARNWWSLIYWMQNAFAEVVEVDEIWMHNEDWINFTNGARKD